MLLHPLLVDALRVALLLAFALAAMPLLRRGSSAVRRLVLVLGLGGALVLPLVTAIAPAWRVPAPASVATLRGIVVAEPLVPADAPSPAPAEGATSSPATAGREAPPLDPAVPLACVWALGALLVLARLGVGVVRTRGMVRRSSPARAWSLAAARAEAATGLRVAVRTTDELDAPAVTGVLSPVVLVPRASASWSDERRHAVLLHELAHVRQRDCLVQLVAQIACAFHWFDPLVWLAARRLRVERELAADDAVIAAGARPSTYAEDLLAIAGVGVAAREAPAGALGMAERSQLAARVTAIVSAHRVRRPPTPLRIALLVAAFAAVGLGIACTTPAEAPVQVAAPAATAVAAPAAVSAGSTIDPRIQAIAEEELGRAVAEWKAVAGAVVVLDPATGEILANAGRDHGAAADVGVRKAYVTGSTIKAFTLAAALEEGVLSTTDRIDCEQGAWTYQGQVLHDWHPNGILTVSEMMAVSSNIGFAKVFDRLGGTRLHRWLRAFHFGDAPAIEGATPGWIPERIEDRSFAGAVASIGEVLTASPLQVASAYGTVANGGVYVAPTFTRRTGSPPRETVLRPETARAVARILEDAVASESSTSTRARVPGLRVAGKTGTAEWDLPGDREGRYASFVGFVPAEAPRFVILVGLEHADEGPSGGDAAAPVFSRVAARALR